MPTRRPTRLLPALALAAAAFVFALAPDGAAAAATKAEEWVANGESNLAAGRPSDALYCFYMASFQKPGDAGIASLVEKAKGEVRRRERGPYVIPREPQNFHYILFRTQTESTMEDTGEGGEAFVKLPDGTRVNVASYINKLRARGRRGGEEPTSGKVVVRRGATNEKLIALTFDDGPSPAVTPKLLKLLERVDAKATFFVVGRNVRAYPDLVRRIAAGGHLLANHSNNHPNMAHLSEAKIARELDAVDEALSDLGLPAPTFFRPPYGAMGKTLVNHCRDTGRTIVLWSIDTNDWRKPSPAKMLRHILNQARPGDVVLMHDIHPQCLDVIEPLVAAMRDAGYRFVLLDELFGDGGSRIAAGTAEEDETAAGTPLADNAPPVTDLAPVPSLPAGPALAATREPAAGTRDAGAATAPRGRPDTGTNMMRFVRRAQDSIRGRMRFLEGREGKR